MKSTHHKNIAVSFLELVIEGNIEEAYEKYISVDFQHHNPYFKGDRHSLKEGMLENEKEYPYKIFEVKHVIEEWGFVVVHSHLRFKKEDTGIITIHIFRIKGDYIVESWDVGQQIPDKVVNENSLF